MTYRLGRRKFTPLLVLLVLPTLDGFLFANRASIVNGIVIVAFPQVISSSYLRRTFSLAMLVWFDGVVPVDARSLSAPPDSPGKVSRQRKTWAIIVLLLHPRIFVLVAILEEDVPILRVGRRTGKAIGG